MKRIYIADIVHEQLKREAKAQGRTLQWVVENKLTGEIPPSPKNIEPKTPAITTPAVADLIKHGDLKPGETVKYTGEPSDPDFSANEMECCQHPIHPCKHWVWDIDTGEGYRNTLSGRYKEAD